MADIDDALARLEQAVARLEAASRRPRQPADEASVAAIAVRVDAALAKLGQLLDREE